jgi:putative SOS response-associated peptidase YedK
MSGKTHGEGKKQPYAISMADDGQMVMAGLWAKGKDSKSGDVLSCTILTCGPNDVMAELHDRGLGGDAPQILDTEPAGEANYLKSLARPTGLALLC